MTNSAPSASFEEVVIIGMAGRFPSANSVDELWSNLRDGVESVLAFTDEDLLASGVDPALLTAPNYIKAGTVLYLTGNDMFGNSYGPFTVDSTVKVPDSAFNTLSDVADNTFWSPYN